MTVEVVRVRDVGVAALRSLLDRYQLTIHSVAQNVAIPGSYWGDAEAGLIGDTLFARADTPVHSVLHEAAHFVCMDATRRASLHRDAGGDYAEEDAVCYLQILWADVIQGFDKQRMWRDMDAWGYTFRLGCAQRWFEEDADEAHAWLRRYCLIDEHGRVTFCRRA